MYRFFRACVLVLLPGLLLGQAGQELFGKNRVQYHRDFDEWLLYESDNFVTYWYGEGRNIGQSVVQFAEYDFNYIQNILEHRINDKIEIVVYTDLTDFKQSNINYNTRANSANVQQTQQAGEEVFESTTGETKFLGNKVFVFFNGDHNDLRRQVREGVASVYLQQMLFGANLQEVLQNAIMMNLPDWFKRGLVAYIGQPWSHTLDNQLRDMMQTGKYTSFRKMAEANPRLIGHSFWYYVAQNWGEASVSNLLYLTRINRSIETGFLYVLSSPYDAVLLNWENFYRERYAADAQNRSEPAGQEITFKNRRNLPVTQFKLSPDGQRVVYVLNEIGRYRVYLHDVNSGDRRVIHQGGQRNAVQATDYNYPLVAWNPSGAEVAILYEHRDVPKLTRYDVFTNKKVTEDLATEYHRVYNLEYVNPGLMVFSATVRGFSDIFLYYPQTRQSQRITNDFYDDLEVMPVKVRNRQGLVWASNRTDTLLQYSRMDTILPVGNFDLFYYDIDNKPGELVRITHTPLADERQPIAIDTTWLGYLSDESGIYNQRAAYLEDYLHHYDQIIRLMDGEEIRRHADSSLADLDSTLIDTILLEPIIRERAVTHTVSNLPTHIRWQSTAPRTGQVATVLYRDEEYRAYRSTLAPDTRTYAPPTIFRQELGYLAQADTSQAPSTSLPPVPTAPATPPDSVLEIPEGLLFQTEFDDWPEAANPARPASEEPTQVITAAVPTPEIRRRNMDSSIDPRSVYRFRPGRIIPYRIQFRVDDFDLAPDNNPVPDNITLYVADAQSLLPPQRGQNANRPTPGATDGLYLHLRSTVKDLFEDHVLEGGIRLPTSFNGTEYYLTYHDRKHRLDKSYTLYRRNQRFDMGNIRLAPLRREYNVVLGQYALRYPLDVFRSLRAITTIRRDRVQMLATERTTLETEPATQARAGLRLEYVFDNTVETALNLRNGTRYKVYVEGMRGFNINLEDGLSADLSAGNLAIAGLDARHYQRLDKRSILALRGAAAFSFGRERMLYYLGGADSEFLASFNQNIPVAQGEQFVLSSLANSLRGFDINIRNGSNFLLGNAELRVPIFRYLSERIRSPFLRNFQVVGFFDIGTAWVGKDPFSPENPINTTTYPSNGANSPVSVRITRFRDPVVYGYGIGARATLFGYFIRADYAWGVETRVQQKPQLHIATGFDF